MSNHGPCVDGAFGPAQDLCAVTERRHLAQ